MTIALINVKMTSEDVTYTTCNLIFYHSKNNSLDRTVSHGIQSEHDV
jgi:hypothetical protein